MPPDSSAGYLSAVLCTQSDHLELGDRDLVHQLLRQNEILAQRKLDVLSHRQRREQRALLSNRNAPCRGRAMSPAIDGPAHDLDGPAPGAG